MDKDTQQYILNILRQGTIAWKGRAECLRRHRKLVHEGLFYKNGNPIYKYYWQCAECKSWFRDVESLEVDHIKEIGPLESWDKIKEHIEKMYCGQDNLQALCIVCHERKTSKFNATLNFTRKNRPQV